MRKFPHRRPTPVLFARAVTILVAAWALLDIVLVATGHPLLRGGQLAWLAVVIFLSGFAYLATVS